MSHYLEMEGLFKTSRLTQRQRSETILSDRPQCFQVIFWCHLSSLGTMMKVILKKSTEYQGERGLV